MGTDFPPRLNFLHELPRLAIAAAGAATTIARADALLERTLHRSPTKE